MDLHNDLFEGPPPAQSRTAPLWPGYDPEPVRHGRRGLFARLFGAQRRARRALFARLLGAERRARRTASA